MVKRAIIKVYENDFSDGFFTVCQCGGVVKIENIEEKLYFKCQNCSNIKEIKKEI